MGKLGFFGVFAVVVVAHIYALQSYIPKKNAIAKPDAKVHRITLSAVVIKKPIPPKPKVEPIILPPDPEPIIEQKVVEKPKPKPKPKKKKKKTKKKRVKKPVVKPKVEEIIEPEPIPVPIVEQVVAPVVTVNTASIIDKYTSEIRRKIQRNLYYPKMAKRMRMQDIVRVRFRVLKNGSITNITVLNKPKKLLKNGAIKTLKSLSLRPIPSEVGEEYLDITIPIEFKLKQG